MGQVTEADSDPEEDLRRSENLIAAAFRAPVPRIPTSIIPKNKMKKSVAQTRAPVLDIGKVRRSKAERRHAKKAGRREPVLPQADNVEISHRRPSPPRDVEARTVAPTKRRKKRSDINAAESATSSLAPSEPQMLKRRKRRQKKLKR